MDNNYYNGEGSQNQNGTGFQNNGYGNGQNGYGEAHSSIYGSNYGNGYGYQSYQNNGYHQEPPKKKGKSGFGVKLVKCAALAAVFGLVSGSVMTGVTYVGQKALGMNGASNTQAALTTSDSSAIKPTAVSSTYAAAGVSDIVEQAMPSIVAITNVSETEYQSFWGQSRKYESTSCGSGIIISQDENYLYIASNNHVVEGANSLTVTFANDDTVSAEIKGTDPSTDLAVLKVALSDINADTMNAVKVASLGSSDSLKVGESCIAIGNALGYGQSVTTGVISALNRVVSVSDSASSTSYTAELIQTDAAINPGNSGGALLNTAGEVIGINSVKYSDTSVEGIGYAIPMDTAKPIIEELITREKVNEENSSYLGIAGVDVTSDDAMTYNMPIGVYVTQVLESSAAQAGGVLQGDIITTFDGKTIMSMEDLTYTMQYYAAGTQVEIGVERFSNGQYEQQTLLVTLGRKN